MIYNIDDELKKDIEDKALELMKDFKKGSLRIDMINNGVKKDSKLKIIEVEI
jgi:hypothetical protein